MRLEQAKRQYQVDPRHETRVLYMRALAHAGLLKENVELGRIYHIYVEGVDMSLEDGFAEVDEVAALAIWNCAIEMASDSIAWLRRPKDRGAASFSTCSLTSQWFLRFPADRVSLYTIKKELHNMKGNGIGFMVELHGPGSFISSRMKPEELKPTYRRFDPEEQTPVDFVGLVARSLFEAVNKYRIRSKAFKASQNPFNPLLKRRESAQ